MGGTYSSTNPKPRTWVSGLDSWIDRKSTSSGEDDGRHRYPVVQPSYRDVSKNGSLLGVDEGMMN
jgi:hypothetical protein